MVQFKHTGPMLKFKELQQVTQGHVELVLGPPGQIGK